MQMQKKLEQQQATLNQNNPPKKSKPKGLIILGGVILLIALPFLVFRGKNGSKTISETIEEPFNNGAETILNTMPKRGDSWVDDETGDELYVQRKAGRPKKKVVPELPAEPEPLPSEQ